jgi:sigma54-dependent transcription regulator
MTSYEKTRALELMYGNLTKGGIDRAKAVYAIRSGDPEALEIVKAARRRWLTWVTLSQRKWQGHTRSVTPRRVAIRKALWGGGHTQECIEHCLSEAVNSRDSYVRCSP